jgi:hypothetical protein
VDQHALLAEQAVDQRRLADVGLADEREPDRAAVGVAAGVGGGLAGGRRCARRLGQPRHQHVEQLADAAPVAGGHREHVDEAEPERLGGGGLGLGGVDLVRRDEHRLARAPQHLGDILVDGGDPLAGVQHEHHHVRFVQRAQRLLAHGAQDAGGRRVEASGVDDAEAHRTPVSDAVAAIARHARHVLDQGRPPTDEAVEQRRLADVGAADQRHQRQAVVMIRGLARRLAGCRALGGASHARYP